MLPSASASICAFSWCSNSALALGEMSSSKVMAGAAAAVAVARRVSVAVPMSVIVVFAGLILMVVVVVKTPFHPPFFANNF